MRGIEAGGKETKKLRLSTVPTNQNPDLLGLEKKKQRKLKRGPTVLELSKLWS